MRNKRVFSLIIAIVVVMHLFGCNTEEGQKEVCNDLKAHSVTTCSEDDHRIVRKADDCYYFDDSKDRIRINLKEMSISADSVKQIKRYCIEEQQGILILVDSECVNLVYDTHNRVLKKDTDFKLDFSVKKIVINDNHYGADFFGLLGEDEKLRIWGTPPLKEGDKTHSVFNVSAGQKLSGKVVLENVTDAWIGDGYIAYIQENNLYKMNYCIEKKPVLVERNCGPIISLDCVGSTYDDWMLSYVKEDGSIYACGQNIAKLIHENKKIATLDTEPQRIAFDVAVNEVVLHYGEMYVFGRDGTVYFWGIIDYSGAVSVLDDPRIDPHSMPKSLLKKENELLVINRNRPLKVSESVKDIAVFGVDREILILDDAGVSTIYNIYKHSEQVYSSEKEKLVSQDTKIIISHHTIGEHSVFVDSGGSIEENDMLMANAVEYEFTGSQAQDYRTICSSDVSYLSNGAYLVGENLFYQTANKKEANKCSLGLKTKPQKFIWLSKDAQVYLDKDNNVWCRITGYPRYQNKREGRVEIKQNTWFLYSPLIKKHGDY